MLNKFIYINYLKKKIKMNFAINLFFILLIVAPTFSFNGDISDRFKNDGFSL